MADLSISNLEPTGVELLNDSETFLDEMSEDAQIMGGGDFNNYQDTQNNAQNSKNNNQQNYNPRPRPCHFLSRL
jgi:hypothetical protein